MRTLEADAVAVSFYLAVGGFVCTIRLQYQVCGSYLELQILKDFACSHINECKFPNIRILKTINQLSGFLKTINQLNETQTCLIASLQNILDTDK